MACPSVRLAGQSLVAGLLEGIYGRGGVRGIWMMSLPHLPYGMFRRSGRPKGRTLQRDSIQLAVLIRSAAKCFSSGIAGPPLSAPKFTNKDSGFAHVARLVRLPRKPLAGAG